MWSGFPYGGSHNLLWQHFAKDWSNTNSCKIVNYETPYNIYVEGDYKRCVCDTSGNGASSCPVQYEHEEEEEQEEEEEEDEEEEQEEEEQDEQDEEEEDEEE